MSETKHTPGPWEVQQYKNYEGFSIWAKGFGCIAERWWPSEEKTIPIEANARLIAAAPELLEACKALADGYTALRTGVPSYPWQVAIDKAIAAMAKAEGRQP